MARDDERQYRMPARQQEGQGRLSRSPWGLGFGEGDWWSASPFQMMRRMQEDMDRIFGSFYGQPAGALGGGPQGLTAWSPHVDVYEADNEIIVKADVPGVEPEDLEVTCTEDALVLRGETRREEDRQEGGWHRSERRYGRFERQIPLPPGTRPDDAKANFRNGVLELRIPKSEEARQRVRRIPITGASGAKGGEAGGAVEGETGQAARQEPPAQGEQGSSAQGRGSKK
jgi:HSP20 family protein